MKKLNRREVLTYIGIPAAALLAVVGLSRVVSHGSSGGGGISDHPVSLGGACIELSHTGAVLTPRSYPTGLVGVQYELVKDSKGDTYGQSFEGEFDQTTGTITGSDGKYHLTIPKLPPVEFMGDSHSNFGPDVALVIDGPAQEHVGLTGACVAAGVVEGQNSVVNLPPTQS